MTRVTPIEGDFLAVARALFGGSYGSVEPILRAQNAAPALGTTALRAFEQTLLKGSVRFVARLGWRTLQRPHAGKTGRLWTVQSLPAIVFSPYAFELVRWLVEEPSASPTKSFVERPRTPWDELLAERVCALVEEGAIAASVARQPGVSASSLVWLMHPLPLGVACPIAWEEAIDRAGFLIEAAQDEIARRSLAFDVTLARASDPALIYELGEAREKVLTDFVAAAEKRGRMDLASFLVDLARARVERALRRHALDPLTPLRDRGRAERARGAQLRVAVSLTRYHEELRLTPHFEDGYAHAQLLLARWEHLGNDGFARARDVLTQHEQLGG